MTDEQRSSEGIGSFPRTFWIANVMELFERGAYYGVMSVLAVYLRMSTQDGGLGFSETSVGFLQSIMLTLTYVMPIVGGALAERYGYRRFLLLAFAVLAVGYFASGHTTSYGVIFLTLLLIAVGSGVFKSILSGTITRTTTDGNRSLGFGVYYWMINLGAFLSPILVSYLKGNFSWSYVFMASAVWCVAMLVLTLVAYREPERPKSTKGMGRTLSEAVTVLRDWKFVLMIVIYSGFWLLYFQMFNTVLWYMVDHVDMTPADGCLTSVARFFGGSKALKFDVAYVTSINAGTIILLQVIVSRIVKNLRALPTMIAGIVIGTAGFIILSISANAWVFIISMVVFSIGEMTCHPKYFSYVGQIAPKDKVAVYMGYSFLYGIIGSLVGNNLGAILYKKIATEMDRPRLLWVIFSGIGILTVIGLAVYDRYLSPEGSETQGVDA
ncbi:MAG: MFS transporter [Candidatus Krumholzibacteria bacterium]|nr:MFS transporter [Candidatus Krumholzibacteria bacterium]